MDIRKKTMSFFFPDIFRSLKVSLRYLLGTGAAVKKGKEIFSQKDTFRKIPVYDADKCVGCRLCANVCPTKSVFVRTNIRPHENPVVEFELKSERCVSCGLCVEACSRNALKLERAKEHVCR
jgi:NADH-quinone oxidoreductase subunit I